MKILLTGSNGYIARNLSKFLSEYKVTYIDRKTLDLLDKSEVNNFFSNRFFDVIINTAVSGGSRLSTDNSKCIFENLTMHQNLMSNKKHFNKFIHFGSGAELDRSKQINHNSLLSHSFPTDPYGMSKNIIAKLEENNKKFFNIRIFNVFNSDELSTRMIKNNIINYIEKKPILIHQNRFMDFFYMDDLAEIVIGIIKNEIDINTLNCSYKNRHCLFNIAKLINNLSDYEVEIKTLDQSCMGNSYFGKFNLLENIKLIGFEEGLKLTYNDLKEKF